MHIRLHLQDCNMQGRGEEGKVLKCAEEQLLLYVFNAEMLTVT